MHLTKELFVIPHKDRFILYAPLKRTVAEVNGDMVNLLKRLKAGEDIGGLEKRLDKLKQLGIVTDGETPIAEYVPKTDYTPTTVTLIPSLDCNLKCVYCYSNAGEGVEKTMDTEVGKAAIDFVIGNALVTRDKKAVLVFHGGGEPFLNRNMGMVRNAVEYFKNQTSSNGLKSDVVGTTNGVMNKKTLEWVASNFDTLNISLDGPEDIQNEQRPTKGGGRSFPQVMKTIEYLESRGFKYHLRATITRESVSRIPEIVEFFNSISSTDRIILEPLYECGRCNTSNAKAPDPEEYIKYLSESRKIAKALGKKADFSGSVVDGIYDCFCRSLDSGFFCVLPDGNVSSCLEVSDESDPRARVFMTGKYDPDAKEFTFHKDRIQTLRSRNVDNIPYCKDCFAKYNCAGDCPSKCYAQSGSLFDLSFNADRCEMAQGVIKEILIEKLKGGDKNDSKI